MLALLLACAPHPAPPATATEPELHCSPAEWPEVSRAPLLAAQSRGFELARRDRYAWEATDRAAEAVGGDLAAAMLAWGASNYVVDEDPAGATVFFAGHTAAGVGSFATVRFDSAHPKGEFALAAAGTPAPADVGTRFLAQEGPLADPRLVAKVDRYNPDVLAWSNDPADGWAVYYLPAAAEYQSVPFGGGYLAHVAPDGRTVLDVLPLSNTVLQVPVEKLANGKGVFTASILSPLPDASIFAFASIWNVALMVVTPTGDVYGIQGPVLCVGRLEAQAR